MRENGIKFDEDHKWIYGKITAETADMWDHMGIVDKVRVGYG